MDFKTFIHNYNGDFNNKDLILSSFLKDVESETDLIQQKQLSVLLGHINFLAELKKGFDAAVSKKNIDLFLNDVERVCSAFDAAKIPAQIYAYFCYCTLIRIHPNYPCEEIKWVDPRDYNLKDNREVSSSTTFGLGAFNEQLADFSFNGAELTNVKEDREIITVPFGVKTISASAFKGLKKVRFISIPNSVSSLPPSAFAGLESVEGIFLSKNITVIPADAFKKCVNLTNVIAPSVTVIGDLSFAGTKIANLKRCGGENIIHIGSMAFKECQNLQTINCPKAFVEFGSFVNCPKLEYVRIKGLRNARNINVLFAENGAIPTLDSLKELNMEMDGGNIPERFFTSYPAEKIVIRNEINTIGKSAFENCPNLVEIKTLFKAPVIQEKAFKDCAKLSVLPPFENVGEIEESAFESCKSLTSLTINGVVNKIGKSAFANCPELTTLNINYAGNSLPESCFLGTEKLDITPFLKNVEILEPHSFTGKFEKQNFSFWSKLRVIRAYAFDKCEIKIENLTIPSHIRFEKQALQGLKPVNLIFENPEIKDEQDNLVPPFALFAASLEEFAKENDSLVGVGVMGGKIPAQFFKGWVNIEKARLGSSINVIPTGCFEDCTNLEAVKLDATSIKFEDRAFYNCKKLTRLLVGDVNVIDGGSLKLGSITGLGQDTFYGCGGINEIIADGNSLIPLMFSEFDGVKKIRLSLNNPESITFGFYYLFADTLEKFNASFTNLKEVEVVSKGVIPDSFFKGCANLETINIQGQVDTIKDYAFADCLKLKEINLNYIGKDVPTGCFMNCQSLSQITLLNVENVGTSAFENCRALSHLVLSRTINQLDDYAFKNCVSLDAIPFEIAANSIGKEAFMGMSKMKELTLSNVDRVGEGAFSSCDELVKVSLRNVHKLEPLIFNKCQKISDFELELADDYSGETRFYQLFESDPNEFNRIYKSFTEITIKVNGVLPSYFFEAINTVKKIAVLGEIKELGEGVFKDCEELEEIAINYVQNKISKNLFLNCKKLTRGLVFASVDDIDESAFENCQALEDITFAPHMRTVEDKAFKGCINLKQMPFSVCPAKIGAEAFMGCLKINDLNIVGASFVGERAFYDIPHFNNIALEQLPNGETLSAIVNSDAQINNIDYFNGIVAPHFFEGMSKLAKVVLPDQNVEVNHNAFYNCTSLKEIVNLDKVTYLGNECLCYCPIESLIINEHARYVGLSILKGCNKIKEITLPLLNVTLGSLFSSFEFEDSIIVDHIVGDDAVKSYYIPKSLKSVTLNSVKPRSGALSSLKDINVTFACEVENLPYSFLRNTSGAIVFSRPEAIRTIAEYALSETSVGDIDFAGVKEVKDYAFMNCHNMKKATFHQDLLSLSKNAFEGTDLEQLNIINNNNFVCECGFTVCKSDNAIIFVDKDIEGEVVIPDLVADISTLLQGKKNITSIDLNQVTFLADEAFKDCTALTSLKMSDKVTNIGKNILHGVPSLEDLIITFIGPDENTPSPLTYLNENGFSVKSLTILKGQIATHFAVNGQFEKIDLSKMSYLDLPNDAFVKCSINELSLPNGTSLNGETVFNDTDIGVFNSDISHDGNFIYYNDTIYMCYHPDGIESVVIDENIKGLTPQSFRGINKLNKLEISAEGLPLEKAFNKVEIKEISLVDAQMEKLDEQFLGSSKSLVKFTCLATSLASNFLKGFTSLKELYLDYLEKFELNLSVNNLSVLSLDSLKEINKSLVPVSYEKLLIGDDLEHIDYDAFTCIRAKQFTFVDNENYYREEGMYIDRQNMCIFATNEECQGDIVIPNIVERIYKNAFRNRKLTSLDTNNVNTIELNAFANCSNLEKVVIGEKAINLAPRFLSGSKVKKLKFNTLPNDFDGVETFFGDKFVPLEKVVVTGEQVYKKNYFANLKNASVIVIANHATTIESNAFNGCKSLLKLVLPQSVEKVEAKAFMGCLGIVYKDVNGKKKELKKNGLTLVVKDMEQVAKFDKNFDLVQNVLFFKKIKVNITTEGWEESNYEL